MNQTTIESATQETIQGMGPIVQDQGVAFRVWAPNADAVCVVGDFNDWKSGISPMSREDSGCWLALIENARVGDEYKYEITNGENAFRRIDPRAREVTNSVGNGIVHDPNFDWQDDDFPMPSWNKLVIYETHIGTFFRDGKEQVGTFEDYIQRFDHLKKLGVNCLQVMPIAEFAGDLSWGYNPAHAFAIETAYGGACGFKTFVREAHKSGFAVILDVVYNHFGPSDLDLWQFDGWSENDKGGIYFYNDHRSSTPWGDTRPDYGRGEVRAYMSMFSTSTMKEKSSLTGAALTAAGLTIASSSPTSPTNTTANTSSAYPPAELGNAGSAVTANSGAPTSAATPQVTSRRLNNHTTASRIAAK